MYQVNLIILSFSCFSRSVFLSILMKYPNLPLWNLQNINKLGYIWQALGPGLSHCSYTFHCVYFTWVSTFSTFSLCLLSCTILILSWKERMSHWMRYQVSWNRIFSLLREYKFSLIYKVHTICFNESCLAMFYNT